VDETKGLIHFKRQQIETYLAHTDSLTSAAKQAFKAEMVREKAIDCKNARSTFGELIPAQF
jgi:hypothetical protein